MGQYRALISCPLIQDTIHDFDQQFERYGVEYDVAAVDQQLGESELLEIIDGYDAILAGDDELNSTVLDSAGKLKVISKWGIGTDNIDHEAAERNDIAVYNTPGAFSKEVANVVVGYLILLTRKLNQIDHSVRAGDWNCPRGTSLAGRTLGVVGVGNIGSEVARRGDALGMDVIGHDVHPLSDELKVQTGIERVDPDTLFERASVVSINCALTPETRYMVGDTELAALGDDGYLINTSRGSIVDQDALVRALENGTIAGAALDVFETEPLPADSPLTTFENVILGSHNAQNTREAVQRVNERAVENLLDGL